MDSGTGVTLAAGGPIRPQDFEESQELAPYLVAADGGADRALELGARPAAVIGDLDSITQSARTELGTAVHHIAEQDSTDFDKALRNINAPFVLGLGLLGGRVDHELSALAVLARRAAMPCLLIGPEDVIFAAPPLLDIAMRAGDRFSLFPFAPVAGRSVGLKWPIDGIEFAPIGRGGTSNMALGPVRLEMDAPGMLVIVPRERLREALAARLAAGAWGAKAC
ncbi:thiamine diphosphokinase [Pseudorhodobacter turbinis]|uniref:Thiamine diphosphokinase n=1 Tax=Pseudorhodobacter turbinis TaxID=2500533 RepID=A0A4P8EH65_9RHOB|nr:thiamine diphosphokinase [Pseudorhodobacter turbinis]